MTPGLEKCNKLDIFPTGSGFRHIIEHTLIGTVVCQLNREMGSGGGGVPSCHKIRYTLRMLGPGSRSRPLGALRLLSELHLCVHSGIRPALCESHHDYKQGSPPPFACLPMGNVSAQQGPSASRESRGIPTENNFPDFSSFCFLDSSDLGLDFVGVAWGGNRFFHLS